MKDVLLIVFGWSLGLFSPAIASLFSRQNRKKETQKVISEELKDIKIRLALMAFQVNSRLGTLDKEFLIWTKNQIAPYDGYEELQHLQKIFSRPDFDNPQKLAELVSVFNHAGFTPSSFSEITTGIIDSNYTNIAVLPREFFVKVLEIKFQLGVLNHESKSSNDYLRMTFDSSLSNVNREIIDQELRNKSERISKKSVFIVEKINRVIIPKSK